MVTAPAEGRSSSRRPHRPPCVSHDGYAAGRGSGKFSSATTGAIGSKLPATTLSATATSALSCLPMKAATRAASGSSSADIRVANSRYRGRYCVLTMSPMLPKRSIQGKPFSSFPPADPACLLSGSSNIGRSKANQKWAQDCLALRLEL